MTSSILTTSKIKLFPVISLVHPLSKGNKSLADIRYHQMGITMHKISLYITNK